MNLQSFPKLAFGIRSVTHEDSVTHKDSDMFVVCRTTHVFGVQPVEQHVDALTEDGFAAISGMQPSPGVNCWPTVQEAFGHLRHFMEHGDPRRYGL